VQQRVQRLADIADGGRGVLLVLVLTQSPVRLTTGFGERSTVRHHQIKARHDRDRRPIAELHQVLVLLLVIVAGDRERDGIFVTNQAVVVVECTVSGRKDKAEKDGKKLQDALATLVKGQPLQERSGLLRH
jgi:hypothetical protein